VLYVDNDFDPAAMAALATASEQDPRSVYAYGGVARKP
jgi:hypothetical protein